MSSQSYSFKLSRFESGITTCYYCEKIIPDNEVEVDHKIPVSRGGTSQVKNLVLSCRHCNRSKYNLTDYEYYDHIIKLAEIFKGRLVDGN